MTDTQFRDTIKTLLAALGSNDPAQRLGSKHAKQSATRLPLTENHGTTLWQFCILAGSTAKSSGNFSPCSVRITTANSTMRGKK